MSQQRTSGQRKSAIPLPGRTSRPTIGSRQSGLSTQKSARSSSVGRNQPMQLFTSKRSISYTNLKEFTTPTCRGGRPSATPFSTPFSGCKYPVNDKQWQTSQMGKVKQFFLELDPAMPPLKPLDLKVFVHSMNLLLSALDTRMQITIANYKESIPTYMTLLKYPNQIKASVLKNPGVPTNWPYIFGMWVWLIDLLISLQNCDHLLRPPTKNPYDYELYKHSVEYMQRRYSLWNNGHDETPADKVFYDNVAKTLNVDLIQVDSLNLKVEKLRKESSELESIKEKMNIDCQAAQERLELLREQNKSRAIRLQQRKDANHARRTALLANKELVASKIKEKSETNSRLMETIRTQAHPYEEKRKLKDQIATLEGLRTCKWKHREERLEEVSKFDMQESEERQRLQEMVCSVNSVISKHVMRPELSTLKIRETRFYQDDMVDEVKTFLNRKKEFDVKFEEEEGKLIIMLKKVKEQNKEISQKNEELEKKISKLSGEQLKATEDLSIFRMNAKSEIEMMETKVQQMNVLLAETKSKRPDLQEMREKLERADKRNVELLAELNKHMEKGEEFFSNIFGTTVNTIAAQQEMQRDITRSTNEAIKMVNDRNTQVEATLDEYLRDLAEK